MISKSYITGVDVSGIRYDETFLRDDFSIDDSECVVNWRLNLDDNKQGVESYNIMIESIYLKLYIKTPKGDIREIEKKFDNINAFDGDKDKIEDYYFYFSKNKGMGQIIPIDLSIEHKKKHKSIGLAFNYF
jgi:hypothetical protein